MRVGVVTLNIDLQAFEGDFSAESLVVEIKSAPYFLETPSQPKVLKLCTNQWDDVQFYYIMVLMKNLIPGFEKMKKWLNNSCFVLEIFPDLGKPIKSFSEMTVIIELKMYILPTC